MVSRAYQPGLFEYQQILLEGRFQVGQQVRYTHYLHQINRRIEQTWVVKMVHGDRYLLERVDTGIPTDWADRLTRVPLQDWQVSNYWAYWRAVLCGPMTAWALEEDIQP